MRLVFPGMRSPPTPPATVPATVKAYYQIPSTNVFVHFIFLAVIIVFRHGAVRVEKEQVFSRGTATNLCPELGAESSGSWH